MIEVVPMTVDHIYELARNLREGDRMECAALGYSPQEIIRKSFYAAMIRRTVLIDGKVGASWGLSGTLLGEVGCVWLLTTPEVEKHYFKMVYLYANQVREMLAMYPRLENYCLASYTKSLRLLKIVGFTVEDPIPYGRNGELFCRFSIEEV